jgi:GNAT superfamily N-acetyltransferase
VLELVHLAVDPTARGRGVGGAIHDTLLADRTARAAVLTVDLRASPARALYGQRGWRPLREAVSIAGGPPATLMVRQLDGAAGLEPPTRGGEASP